MSVNLLPHHLSRHLEEEELLPATGVCSFCGSASRRPVGTLQEAPDVLLLECTDCHSASASRFPKRQTLDDYYREDFYRLAACSSHGQRVTFDSTQRFGRILGRRVERHLEGRGLDILDFGGGDGSLSLSVARRFLARGGTEARIAIVDYGERLASPGDARVAMQRFDTLDATPPSSHDLVIASAVIEHLVEPRDTLLRLLEMVRPGGLFYARTPFVVPFMKLFSTFGLKWDFFYPAHLHDLGQDFWESFLGKAGLAHDFRMLESRPSTPETSFHDHFFTTIAARLFKAPWHLLGRRYGLVGGWEVFLQRSADGRAGLR